MAKAMCSPEPWDPKKEVQRAREEGNKAQERSYMSYSTQHDSYKQLGYGKDSSKPSKKSVR